MTLTAAFNFPLHPLSRDDGERIRGAWSSPPSHWLIAHQARDIRPILDQAHEAAKQGAWVLGGLRYEAANALNPALPSLPTEGPLAAFAVYTQAPEPWPAPPPNEERCDPWQQALHTEAQDARNIERIREHIRAGDCYQVNLTTRLHSQLQRPLHELFLALHAAQPGGFSLFLAELGVASVSPELFFDWRPLPEHPKTWLLAAQPMKGTAARGADRAADEAAQQHLRTSEKERAENLMIVDLLRNDLGQVAQTGSVRVPRLFELHELPSVWQMTSTVTAITQQSLSLAALFAALFPCGSVTGAPKRSAMQRIAELEAAPRGWYCGALGLIQPGGAATFNVPIRTVEAVGRHLRAGVGSGITLDSEPAAELAEWRAKTRFLEQARAPVAALETLLLDDGRYPAEAAHLARLARSARHFGLAPAKAQAQGALRACAAAHPSGRWRVRLTQQASGLLHTEATPLQPIKDPLRLALAPQPIATRGPLAAFIAHKTTRREVYEAFGPPPSGCWDWLLWNEDGELTEGCFGNIALRVQGEWLTPRQQAGLLPGIGRAQWLREGRVREAALPLALLDQASELAWFNSLRGWSQAVLASSAG